MDGNEELVPLADAVNEPLADYAAKKRRILVLLCTYSALLGVLNVFLPEEDSPLDFILALPLLILGISWCTTDAAESDYRLSRLMRLVVIWLFPVGLTIYLFQTRGFGAFKTLAFTLTLVAAMFACMIATTFATVATLCLGDVAGLWEFDG